MNAADILIWATIGALGILSALLFVGCRGWWDR